MKGAQVGAQAGGWCGGSRTLRTQVADRRAAAGQGAWTPAGERRPAHTALPAPPSAARAIGTLLALVALPGCVTDFLQPRSTRGLPARPAPTAGGALLEADQGELYVVPAKGDLEAALGVGLEDDPKGGVRVTNRLRPGAPHGLEPGDRIVAAVVPPFRAYDPTSPGPEELAWLLGGREGPLARGGPRREDFTRIAAPAAAGAPPVTAPAPAGALPVAGTDFAVRVEALGEPLRARAAAALRAKGALELEPADLRRLPGSHAVASLADLAGYGAARGWARLHLGVVRRGTLGWAHALLERPRERVAALRSPGARPKSPLAWTTPWPDARATFLRFGYELGPVEALPPEHRPAAARPGDHVVLFVARGSPAAVAGLRPLDLVDDAAARALAAGGDERVEVRAGDGRAKAIRPDWPQQAVHVWIPLLFTYQWDGARRHVGVGPFDVLFHFVTSNVYDPEEDDHERFWRTSVLGLVQRLRWRTRNGSSGMTHVSPFDEARARYVADLVSERDPP